MNDTPYEQVGGEAAVLRLAARFYDVMERDEPALAAVHRRDAAGRVTQDSRDRFALFLIGWLGGPQTYMERHGHPRLCMRHGHLAIDQSLRDAWMRSMTTAMDELGIAGDIRGFLEQRLGEVASFLRNSG
ncbi:MAG: cyanoglobin [Myxococcales bacterium]|nr:cyanoglobin [Myxococcales bacterium]